MRKVFYLLLILIFPAHAGKYPIVTSATAEYRSGIVTPTLDIHITQAILEIGPAADALITDTQHYAQISLALKECQASDSCMVTNKGGGGLQTNTTESIGEQAIKAYNSFGKNVNLVVVQESFLKYGESCLGYVAFYQDSGTWESSSDVLSPGGCTVFPPPKEWCHITTPDIILEHGEITLQQAEGDIASATLGVQCTSDTSVTFSLMTQDKYIYLDDGKSEISVDNKPLNTKIDLPQGQSQLSIKDSLTGVTKEGFHTGSSVLIMMPY